MDSSVYIMTFSTDWDVCMETLTSSIGFVEETEGSEQLEGPLAYVPLTAKNPL